MVQGFLARMKRTLSVPKVSSFMSRKKCTILYVAFIAIALVQGIVFSFLIPMGQVPDEIAHYQMIEREFGTEGYVNELINDVWFSGGFSNLPRNSAAKVDSKAVASISSFRFSKPLALTSFHPSIGMIRHFPAGLGFFLGIVFGLPMLTCTYLAEIFSVLFYVGIGFLAVKITPVKKEIFAFCLLIPICLQQCSSVSYDAVLIPVSILLFAYILHLYNYSEPIRWKQVCCIAVMTFVLLVSKAPYALIALTIFIIPIDRFELKIGQKLEIARLIRKFRIAILLALIVLCGVFIYFMRDNAQIKTVIADVLSFPDFFLLLKRTFTQLGYSYFTQLVGVFGWLDSEVSSGLIVIFLGMMVWLNTARTECPERELNPRKRIWIITVAVVVMLLCVIAIQEYTYQYLSYDANVSVSYYREYIGNLDSILGFQGRYCIPILPVILIGLSGKTSRKRTTGYYGIQLIYYSYVFIRVVQLLRYRYWI